MILVTVGAQMAFDRLVAAVDDWAGRTPGADVFAQIGPSELRPQHVRWEHFLDPAAFRERVVACDAIVAHAGMGSILTALEYGKPILVMPRRGDLQETRNDHQVATAARFREMGRVAVADDATQLAPWLDRLKDLRAAAKISPYASDELIGALRAVVRGAAPAAKADA